MWLDHEGPPKSWHLSKIKRWRQQLSTLVHGYAQSARTCVLYLSLSLTSQEIKLHVLWLCPTYPYDVHYEKIVIDPDSLFHELHITGLDNNLMPVGILGGGLRGWCKLCVQNSGYPGTGVVFHSSRVSLPLSFRPTIRSLNDCLIRISSNRFPSKNYNEETKSLPLNSSCSKKDAREN